MIKQKNKFVKLCNKLYKRFINLKQRQKQDEDDYKNGNKDNNMRDIYMLIFIYIFIPNLKNQILFQQDEQIYLPSQY